MFPRLRFRTYIRERLQAGSGSQLAISLSAIKKLQYFVDGSQVSRAPAAALATAVSVSAGPAEELSINICHIYVESHLIQIKSFIFIFNFELICTFHDRPIVLFKITIVKAVY